VIAPGVSFDSISAIDLDSLVKSGLPERRAVEYKRDLPSTSDGALREFLADVTSFANAAGGDLLFGIRAEAGVPKEVAPLSFEPDSERLKWENVIRDGVQPRIPGVRVKEISVDGGHALLFRIPQSWVAPHAVTLKGSKSFRFYSRNSAGKYPLDIGELRDAFLAGSSLGDRIRNFRTERLGRIVANEGPIPLPEGAPKLVAHLVPYRGMPGASSIELNAAGGSGLFKPGFSRLSNDGERWNIDGLLTYSLKEGEPADGYTQIFRDGAFELVDAYSLRDHPVEGYISPLMSGHVLEWSIVLGICNSLEVMKRLGLDGPIAVLCSLLGANGYALVTGDRGVDAAGWRRFDRDTILLPDIVLEDIGAIVAYRDQLPPLMRSVADAAWQAAGWLRSPNFHASGEWHSPVK
jgi:hypothetical protein